jgi:Rieske 2Fe-2S family protein
MTSPYHAWSYDVSGKLARTPFVFQTPDFRKEDRGLFPVRVHQWHAFHFVCLAEAPPAFSGAPDLGAHALDNWPMEELVTGHALRKRIAFNWKVFWEDCNECLHCPGIHPELSDTVPVYGKGYMAANEAPDWKADQGTRLKPGARTWTITGKPCSPELRGLTEEVRSRGQTFLMLLPTMYVVAHVDYVRAESLTPIGPEETELRAEWLFPRETMEAPGFDLAEVTGFASTVMQQDGAACETNQRGLRSLAFEAGRLMPQEFDVHNFHQWVRRQLATTK